MHENCQFVKYISPFFSLYKLMKCDPYLPSMYWTDMFLIGFWSIVMFWSPFVLFYNVTISIGRLKKISIPVPFTAFWNSEGKGGALNWESKGMGTTLIRIPKAWGGGGFQKGQTRVSESTQELMTVQMTTETTTQLDKHQVRHVLTFIYRRNLIKHDMYIKLRSLSSWWISCQINRFQQAHIRNVCKPRQNMHWQQYTIIGKLL